MLNTSSEAIGTVPPPSPRLRPVYLDNHATTPVDPRVAELMFATMTANFGNAHSVDHAYGQTAAALIQEAESLVSALVGTTPSSVRFTTGATEGIRLALAIACTKRTPLRIALSRVEHKAVLETVQGLHREGRATVSWINVDSRGRISLEAIREALKNGIDLLCLMAANNEVGTIYPVEAAATLAAEFGAEILVDATPAIGRTPVSAEDWGIDYLVLSAHKIYGPKGAGALVGPSARTSAADQVAGHPGTPNVPAIVGFGEACRIAAAEGPDDRTHARSLRDRLEHALLEAVPDLIINGDQANRLGNNLHISPIGAPNDAILARLQNCVAISTGAACSSGAQEHSHVLRAMNLPRELQESALRISTGKFNTADD